MGCGYIVVRRAKEMWNEGAKNSMLGHGEGTPQYSHWQVWTWMVLMGEGVTRNGPGDEKHLSSTDTPDFGR